MTTKPGSTPVPPAHPERLGRYALRAELASGGMASVFLAELRGLHGFEKVVAIKRIHPHLARNRRFVSMFLDEARLVGLIHHPNVCAIIDFGEDRGAPYLVMEYLAGEPFSSVVKAMRRDGERPYWLAARVVHDAARGLHAAHQLVGADGKSVGVVHRDVSPQNIVVLYDGVTKVVDFGVARARGRLSGTNTSELKGKISYMSPEQLNAQSLDRRTDVWALGVVLWEATVGRRLFRADSDGATVNLVLNSVIPRPTELEPEYPPALEAIVMRCLARAPEERFETAEALADALERFLYELGEPAGSTQVGRWMEAHFAERIAQQEAFLRGETAVLARHDGTSLESELRPRPPAASLARDAEPTMVERPVGVLEEASVVPAISGALPAARSGARGRRRTLYATAAGGALAAVLALALRPSSAPPPSPAAASASGPPPSASRADPAAEVAPPFDFSAGVAAAPEVAPEDPAAAATVEGEATAADEAERTAREGAAPPTEDHAAAVAPEGAAPSRDDAEAVARAEETRSRRAYRHASRRRRHAEPATARAEPATARAEPATAALSGTLNLIAIPYATVSLDGRVLGNTPLVRQVLPAGRHQLVLRAEDGTTKTVTVQIRPGELSRLRVEL